MSFRCTSAPRGKCRLRQFRSALPGAQARSLHATFVVTRTHNQGLQTKR